MPIQVDDVWFHIFCIMEISKSSMFRSVSKDFKDIIDQSIAYLLSQMTVVKLTLANKHTLTMQVVLQPVHGIGLVCYCRDAWHKFVNLKYLSDDVIWVESNITIRIINSHLMHVMNCISNGSHMTVYKQRLPIPLDWPVLCPQKFKTMYV